MLQANGVPTSTLSSSNINVDFAASQVTIHAVQAEDTFFMRIIPFWRTVDVSADATADFNSYAEINTKPYGQAGVVNELNISVWGIDSFRQGGDAYSPYYISGNTVNDEHAKMPYGYLYRIDVPADFPDDHLSVQLFDPDTYNNPSPPPTPNTPIATATFCPGACNGTKTATPYATPTLYGDAGQFTYCWDGSVCSTNGARYNTGLKLGAFPLTSTPIPSGWQSRRVGFWRVDEFRRNRTNAGGINPSGNEWDDNWTTQTNFTLWHFNPHITSAFADPATLSDQPSSAYLARYSVGADARTDRSWYQPAGFDITLSDPSNPACTYQNNECYERESNGNFYFYLYVQSVSNGGPPASQGSSENNFDIRVGPKQQNVAAGYACDTIGSLVSSICMANNQYYAQTYSASPPPDWDDGTMEGAGRGATVLAKRALPLNLDTGDNFPMLFTQVSKNAAGQALAIRHFDQDCTNGCGPSHTQQYQMQLCQVDGSGNYSPCSDLLNNNCYGNVGVGYVGPDNGWYCSGCPAPEKVSIPVEGSANYTSFFGPAGQCSTSWLRLQADPSYSQDTTVWEMPFSRPRLIK